MARFLIAAMESSGHRARLVRWVMEAEVMRQAEVILSGPRSLLEHKELVALRGRFVPQEVSIDKATATALARSSWVDLVILPAADDALDAWAVLGTGFAATRWLGISMRPAFHLGSMRDVVAPSRR